MTHRFKLHTIPYTLDNLLHNAPVISVRLVVTKTHEPPRVVLWVPVTLDDSLVPLYARLLDAKVTFTWLVKLTDSAISDITTHASHSASVTTMVSKKS
jgi:hypothetical protein